MPTETTALIGQALGQGRYHVKRKLGEGGMAYVLLALDNTLGADVVLKVPKPAMLADPEFAHRFKREIRSMIELTHPHIVKIKDVGEFNGLPFYVMDLLTGGSLEDRFEIVSGSDKKKPMPASSLADWLEPVARALDFIHQRFVHRDIKPANILFDSYGNAMVSDFGIVKAIASDKKQTVMTQAGMVIGTGPYMAPEVTEGKKYDGRADQYALAATVFEALAGRVPFDGATLPAIIMQQMSGKIPALHDLVPGLPRALSQAIEKGLSREPENRYVNCAAFAKAVLAAANTVPAAAPAPARKSGAGLRAVCPACKQPFALPPDPDGRSITCPSCKAAFRVAKRSTQPAAAVDTIRSAGPTVTTPKVAEISKQFASAAGDLLGKSGEWFVTAANRIGPLKNLSRRAWITIGIGLAVGLFGVLGISALLVSLFWRRGPGERNKQ